MRSPLPLVTVDDVLSWEPCHSERKVRELAAPLGDRFDALAVLRAGWITIPDRMWTVLRNQMISAPLLREFACRSCEWHAVLVSLSGVETPEVFVNYVRTRRAWTNDEATDEELNRAAWDAWDAWAAAWSAWAARPAWVAAWAAWVARYAWAAWDAWAAWGGWTARDAWDAWAARDAWAAWAASREIAVAELITILEEPAP